MTPPNEDRATRMRREFDGVFAAPPRLAPDTLLDLVTMRLGGHAHAVRVVELAGLFVDRNIVPVPSQSPGLLGIVGLRGGLLPVFDLGALLGYPAAADPRWLMVAVPRPVAFAFEAFDGHVRVATTAVAPAGDASLHVRDVVRHGAEIRPIVQLSSVIEMLFERVQSRSATKE